MTALPGRERDVHLIKPKEILLPWRIRGYLPVAIEDICNEGKTFPFWQVLRPLDESDGAEGEKGGSRLEVPDLGFGLGTADLKAVPLRQITILLRREVEIRVVEGSKVADPAWREARFLRSRLRCSSAYLSLPAAAVPSRPALRLSVWIGAPGPVRESSEAR